MGTILVETREGLEYSVVGQVDRSIMELIRNAGIDEMIALCGGCRSCATCHIHVDPAFVDRLPSMRDDEDELLDSSDHRTSNSRLACQIMYREEFDGLRVTIAKED